MMILCWIYIHVLGKVTKCQKHLLCLTDLWSSKSALCFFCHYPYIASHFSFRLIVWLTSCGINHVGASTSTSITHCWCLRRRHSSCSKNWERHSVRSCYWCSGWWDGSDRQQCLNSSSCHSWRGRKDVWRQAFKDWGWSLNRRWSNHSPQCEDWRRS